MRKSVFNYVSLVLFVMFLLVLSLGPVYAKDEVIQSIDDLNKSSESIFIQSIFSPHSYKTKDEIIVLYNNDSPNNIGSLGLDKQDFKSGESIDSRIDVLQPSGKTSTEELIQEIDENANVEAVDYNDTVQITDLNLVNDAYFERYQKAMFDQVNAEKTLTLGFSNLIKVAVLDTGLDNHVDIKDRYLPEGYNYVNNSNDWSDDNGHGTGVAGVISAIANNKIGLAGFTGTSNVRVVPYKVLDKDGYGRVDQIVKAIKDINKTDIKVLNLSFGLDNNNKVFKAAIEEAYNNGKIIIAASGNDNLSHLYYPARYDKVISVGAVNSDNIRCTSSDWGRNYGSNYGEGLCFVAPGNEVALLADESKYELGSGTSFSTPIVSALTALILEENPNLTYEEVFNTIKNYSRDLGKPGYDLEYGYGLIDFNDSIQSLVQTPEESDPEDPGTVEIPGTSTDPEPEVQIPPMESIELNQTQLNMVINQIDVLSATSNSERPIMWSSSDSNVVSINGGVLHALRAGKATITATLVGTEISASCKVNVSSVDILAISAHSQNVGWIPAVSSMQLAGTTGKNFQLEALELSVADPKINISTQVHVSNIGDMNEVPENIIAGTTGRGLGIEAVKFNLTGENAQYYNLYYRTHVENYGWTNWAKAGNWVGTKGKNLQTEAVELCLTDKDSPAPNVSGNVNWTYLQ